MNMMMTFRNIASILSGAVISIALLTSSSCKKEEECAYPNLTKADIRGNVQLYDDAKEALDKSGMAVTIFDATGIIPAFTDTSDSNGNYKLKDVPFGNYTLYFQKDGYGTLLFGVNHVEDCKLETDLPQLFLGQKSTTTITSFSAATVAAHVELDLEVYPIGTVEDPRYLRIFFKNSSDVSNSSYTYQSGILFTESNSISISLSVGELHGFGFVSGETIYGKAYGESFYSNEYFDSFLGKSIYPNTNIVTPPNVEFIVP
jgi:hypothetical protein